MRKVVEIQPDREKGGAIDFGMCYISNDSYYDAGVVSVKGSVIQ